MDRSLSIDKNNDYYNDSTLLLLSDNDYEVVHLNKSIVMIPFSISSKYSSQYVSALRDIMTPDELDYIVDKVNDSIQSNVACIPVQVLSYGLCICSLGLSLLLPKICITGAETNANNILEQISLTSKYYDRKITFHIIKNMFTSHIIIRYPKYLKNDIETIKLDNDNNSYISNNKKGT